LNESSLELNILLKDSFDENWSVGFKQKLSCEKGIKNNCTKLLFHYSVYLVRYLKQKKRDKTTPYSDSKNSYNCNIKSNSRKILSYYFKLVIIVLQRQLKGKKLNWKLAIIKNEKTYFIT